jgi:hypothetical protein
MLSDRASIVARDGNEGNVGSFIFHNLSNEGNVGSFIFHNLSNEGNVGSLS